MIKRYGYRGIVEKVVFFKHPKYNIGKRVLFTGGAVNEDRVVPAEYSTNDKFTQMLIEMSELFQSGRIKVTGKFYEISDLKTEKKGNKTDAQTGSGVPTDKINAETVVYENVRNLTDAKLLLGADPYNLSPDEMRNKDIVKAKARELNISFPNWN